MVAADDDSTPPTRAALPAERAFVVQLRADADLSRGVVAGRIEHVVSGVASLFESVEQLVGRMRDAIAGRPEPDAPSAKRSEPRRA